MDTLRRRKGTGTIRLRGNSWQIRYATQPNTYFAETVHGSREDAEEILARRMNDIRGTREIDPLKKRPKGWSDRPQNELYYPSNINSPKPRRKTISPKLRWQIFTRDNFTCKYCNQSREHGVVLEIDHIIPVKAGGDNSFNNLNTSCYACNHGKITSILDGYIESGDE